MTWLRWALVVAAFQTEIRVRAHMSPESLTRPEGCLSAKGDCEAKVGAATLFLEKNTIAVSPGGLLQRKDGDWKLLRGTLRAKNVNASSVYGRLEPAAEAWLVDEGQAGLLVGCSSFRGADWTRHRAGMELLSSEYVGPVERLPGRKAEEVVGLDLAWPVEDRRAALAGLPPLLRTYLGMGGWVSDHAVVDRELDTLHVFTCVEVDRVPAARAASLRAVAG